MNTVELGLTLSVGAAVIGAASAAVVPIRHRPAAGGGSTALVGLGGVLAGAGALSGQVWSARVEGLLPLGTTRFAVDPLSGAFLLLVGAVAVVAGIYAIGYTAPGGRHPGDDPAYRSQAGLVEPSFLVPTSIPDGHGAASRTAQLTLPLFVAAMLGVALADSVGTLLVLWELMALTSLVLVLAEHRSRPAVAEAGLWYAGMTHLGFVALLVGLAVFAGEAGGESFAELRAGAEAMPSATRTLIFLLVLVGFGSKAGAVPLHVWLPRAHPEAPSHVSALMSAAMVKLGVYGLVRVWFDLLGGGPRWWGVLALAVGALSALYGVLQASVCTDLKKLLGYSTTENVGLILMGIGSAALFAAEGNRTLASLLMAAALLHAINHAAFKSLLFLGAGSALRATGTRDLDALGGLAGRMPITTALMAIGAFAAAALPPSNGFVSEWLLLQGLIHSLPGGQTSSVVVAVTMPLAVGVVALTAGLGAVTFVKAFGVGFLARPRSAAAAAATESPPAMRAGMALAAAGCAALAAVPMLGAPVLTRVVGVLPSVRDGAPVHRNGVSIELAGIAGSMSPLVILAGLVLAAAGTAALARALSPARRRRAAPLWACGGAPPGARMEYTATSFAEPLTRVFEDVLEPEIDIEISPSGESQFLLERVRYRQSVPDRIEARLYPPVLAAGRRWGQLVAASANGSVHRYLAVGFLGLLTVLIVVGLTA